MEPRHAAAGARQVVFVPLGVGPHALVQSPGVLDGGWDRAQLGRRRPC